jgi:hypothetical protein
MNNSGRPAVPEPFELSETDLVANLGEQLKAAAGGDDLAAMQKRGRDSQNPNETAGLKQLMTPLRPEMGQEKSVLERARTEIGPPTQSEER